MSGARELPFWKMSGSGNDFIIIDNRRGLVPASSGAGLANALCTRRFSVGGDGMILIEKSRTADFSWRFFNADGSEAAMCGNGGRCAARFASLKGIAGERMTFETGAGLIRAEVKGEDVKLQLPEPYGFQEKVRVKRKGGAHDLGFIIVGVPHAVLKVKDIERAPVREWGREIRFHETFAPDGANANFIQVLGARRIALRTYERGVEGETMACGTGAVASALVAASEGLVRSPVRVLTRGGEQLTVYFRRRKAAFREVYLEGAANLIYKGKALPEAAAPDMPERNSGR